ncbi:hypothetical protein RHECNPAF_120002 [Rhizobium etli CNPAF512]|nr:hypothetical protein RHECNPAF_120002 [Rhizobium etli CNPAF512]
MARERSAIWVMAPPFSSELQHGNVRRALPGRIRVQHHQRPKKSQAIWFGLGLIRWDCTRLIVIDILTNLKSFIGRTAIVTMTMAGLLKRMRGCLKKELSDFSEL